MTTGIDALTLNCWVLKGKLMNETLRKKGKYNIVRNETDMDKTEESDLTIIVVLQ